MLVHLEEPGPLSQSVIWQIERDAYAAQGVDGWRAGTVPHYITSNPFIAGSYASVVLGFLRDCAVRDDIDRSRPIDIVELGAGPGRFGFHFVRQLVELTDQARLAGIRFRYVLTDLADDNVQFWTEHTRLAPFVEAGLLDFARFDVANDTELVLLASGDVISPGQTANPAVLIANYLFDSVPQDCYRTRGGAVVPLDAAAVSTQAEPDLADPTVLDRVDLSFTEASRSVSESGLDDASLAVLGDYGERLGDTVVLWPSVAIDCLTRLGDLWGGGVLLISGDKGYNQAHDLVGQGRPDLVQHGSVFSLMVNFHAIGEWCRHTGGMAMHPAQRHANLNISMCALGMSESDLVESIGAYRRSIEVISPDDFFSVVLSPEYPVADLQRFLANVRLSGFDADTLLRHMPGVSDQLLSAPMSVKTEIAWTVDRVWETYYPMGEMLDLPFYLGNLFYELGWYREAIEYLERSLEFSGPAGETYFNLAISYYGARDLDRALELLDEAEAWPESVDGAKAIRMRIDAEMGRRGPGREIARAVPAAADAARAPKASKGSKGSTASG